LQDLQDAAAAVGLLFPLSLASQGSAQIGGIISTNAGGVNVLRYGNTSNLVLGIEAVLANGQIISGVKKLVKDNTGYHLAQYFVGAEGTLGIVTAATLRLFPQQRQKLVAFLAISSPDAALQLLSDLRAEAAEYLNAFEIISHAALERVVHNIPGTRYPCGVDAAFYLLVELGSSSIDAPLRDMFEHVVVRALESRIVLDAVVAQSLSQAQQFWHLREHISEALRKECAVIHFDIALPIAQIGGFLLETEPRIKEIAPDIIPAPFGHIGDGNIHYNMYFPQLPDKFGALKEDIKKCVYGAVQNRQGSISAEHGIGTERRLEINYTKSAAEIEMMKAVKKALDLDDIMNPGKIFL
jgi:FAD/FMN-containing dehydrogenase